MEVPLAYRIMEVARKQALDALAGAGHDPMGGMYLFLESIVADLNQRHHLDLRPRVPRAMTSQKRSGIASG